MPINLPANAEFADLQLEREPITLRLLYAPASMTEICRANSMDTTATLADEDLSCWLICEWYVAHRETGGEPDTVAEAILVEVADPAETGGTVSHWR